MKILSITAQKPSSTGSGVYLTELVKAFSKQGHKQQFEEAFLTRIRKVLEVFQPDLLISHHLYLLTALLRENFPELTIGAFCHNTDLRQLARHDLKKAFILENIRKLDRVYALQEAQKQEIMKVFGLPADRITIAEALDEAVQAPKTAPADASRISFGGIAARVLKASGVQPAENRKDFS